MAACFFFIRLAAVVNGEMEGDNAVNAQYYADSRYVDERYQRFLHCESLVKHRDRSKCFQELSEAKVGMLAGIYLPFLRYDQYFSAR